MAGLPGVSAPSNLLPTGPGGFPINVAPGTPSGPAPSNLLPTGPGGFPINVAPTMPVASTVPVAAPLPNPTPGSSKIGAGSAPAADPRAQLVAAAQTYAQTHPLGAMLAPTGAALEQMYHGGLNLVDRLIGNTQGAAAQQAALQRIAQNSNLIQQGNSAIKGIQGTAERAVGGLLPYVPELAAASLAPEVEGATMLGNTLRGATAALAPSELQSIGQSVGSGQGVLPGVAGGVFQAIGAGMGGGAVPKLVEGGIAKGSILSGIGEGAKIGALASPASQIGQNITTGQSWDKGALDSAVAGALGGALLGGAGATVSKLAQKGIGAVRGRLTQSEIAPAAPVSELAAPVETPAVEPETGVATPVSAPAAQAPLRLSAPAINVPPTDYTQLGLRPDEQQPAAGGAYAQEMRNNIQADLDRDAATTASAQDRLGAIQAQNQQPTVGAPDPFMSLVGQYNALKDAIENPTLAQHADTVAQFGIKPNSLPEKVKNAPNIVKALDEYGSGAVQASKSESSVARGEAAQNAAAAIRQNLGVLRSHQDTLGAYLSQHPIMQEAAARNQAAADTAAESDKVAPAETEAEQSASAQEAAPTEPVATAEDVTNPANPHQAAVEGQTEQGLENELNSPSAETRRAAEKAEKDVQAASTPTPDANTTAVGAGIDKLANPEQADAWLKTQINSRGAKTVALPQASTALRDATLSGPAKAASGAANLRYLLETGQANLVKNDKGWLVKPLLQRVNPDLSAAEQAVIAHATAHSMTAGTKDKAAVPVPLDGTWNHAGSLAKHLGISENDLNNAVQSLTAKGALEDSEVPGLFSKEDLQAISKQRYPDMDPAEQAEMAERAYAAQTAMNPSGKVQLAPWAANPVVDSGVMKSIGRSSKDPWMAQHHDALLNYPVAHLYDHFSQTAGAPVDELSRINRSVDRRNGGAGDALNIAEHNLYDNLGTDEDGDLVGAPGEVEHAVSGEEPEPAALGEETEPSVTAEAKEISHAAPNSKKDTANAPTDEDEGDYIKTIRQQWAMEDARNKEKDPNYVLPPRTAARRAQELKAAQDFIASYPGKANSAALAAWVDAGRRYPAPLVQAAIEHAQGIVDKIFGKGAHKVEADNTPGIRGATDYRKILLTHHAVRSMKGTVLHEAAHLMRELYMSPTEKKLADGSIAPGTVRFKRLQAWAKTQGNAVEDQVKNNPAERYAYYAEAVSTGALPKPTGIIGRVMGKLEDHFGKLHSYLVGHGYNSVDDFIKAANEGTFAGRRAFNTVEDIRGNWDREGSYSTANLGSARQASPEAATGDRKAGYNINDIVEQEVNKAIKDPKVRAKGIFSHVGAALDQMNIPSTMAHIYSQFRPLYEAYANRYADSRAHLTQIARQAPAFFSKDLGAYRKYSSKDIAAASKVLQEGDQERTIYSDEQLAAKGLTPAQIEIYKQGIAASQATLKEKSDTADTRYKMLRENLQGELSEIAKSAPSEQERKDAASVIQMITKLESSGNFASDVAKTRADMKKMDLGADTQAHAENWLSALTEKNQQKTKLARLANEGYLAHLRDAPYLVHLYMHVPTSQIEHVAALKKLDEELQQATRDKDETKIEGIGRMIESLRDNYNPSEETTAVPMVVRGMRNEPEAKAAMQAMLNSKDAQEYAHSLGATHLTAHITSTDKAASDTHSVLDMYNVLRGLNNSGVNLDSQSRAALMKMMLSHDSAAFNQMVARQDIGGQDKNVAQSLARSATFAAEQHAALKHALEIGDARRAITDPRIKRYAQAYEEGLNPGNAHQLGFENTLREITGLSMLGAKITPALYTAFTNLPLMLTNLARNENIGAAASRATKALRDTLGVTPNKIYQAAEAGKGLHGMAPDEVTALRDAMDDGTLDPQFANLVLHAHSGRSRLSAALIGTSMKPLSVTEHHLRMATYLAGLRQHAALGGKVRGFDLDKEGKPLTEADAKRYARHLTVATNQNYNREDSIPLVNRVGDLKTILQFATPTWRIIAGPLRHLAKTDPKLLGTLMAAVGALGGYGALPGAQDAETAYNALTSLAAQQGTHLGPIGNGESAQYILHKFIKHELPPEAADAVMHGLLSRAPGGLDLAPYISMGDIGEGALSAVAKAGLSAMGAKFPTDQEVAPVQGLLKGAFSTAGDLANGNLYAASHDDPISAIRNLSEAIQEAKSGQALSRLHTHPIPVSGVQAAARALGIGTTKESNLYGALGQIEMQRQTRAALEQEANAMLLQADLQKNPAMAAEAQRRVAAWNRSNKNDQIFLNMPNAVEKRMRQEMLGLRMDPLAAANLGMIPLSGKGLPNIQKSAQ